MRKFLILVCCGLAFPFVLVSGAAHVHQSSDHHDFGDHGRHHHRHSGPDTNLDHHEGDAVYLDATLARSSERRGDSMPALVLAALAVGPPTQVAARRGQAPPSDAGPPIRDSAPPRAPPA